MFGLLFGALEQWVISMLMDLCGTVLSFVNSISTGFWDNALIQVVVSFFGGLSMIVLLCSLLFAIFDVAEEFAAGKAVEWGTMVLNFAKSFGFILAVPILCGLSMEMGNSVISYIGYGGLTNTIEDVISNGVLGQLLSLGFIITLFIGTMMVIGICGFFFMSLMRFSQMLVHFMTAPLYIPDITRGNTASMGDWLRQMVAISCTYLFQYLLFVIGLNLLGSSGFNPAHLNDFFLGIGLWLGMFGVPKLLTKFGMSSGTTGILNSASSMAIKATTLFT